MNLRFHVDFNEVDDTNRVRIWDDSSWVDLKPLNAENLKHLYSGQKITLYDGEGLEIDAIAGFDEEHQFWYGILDLSTRRDVPPPTESEN